MLRLGVAVRCAHELRCLIAGQPAFSGPVPIRPLCKLASLPPCELTRAWLPVVRLLSATYQEFWGRSSPGSDIAHLVEEAIAGRICPGQRHVPSLAAKGFTSSGARVLLHLMASSKEDAESVCAFYQDMRWARSIRTCAGAVSEIPCWWSQTGLRASSRRSRLASRARHASAALLIGCVI